MNVPHCVYRSLEGVLGMVLVAAAAMGVPGCSRCGGSESAPGPSHAQRYVDVFADARVGDWAVYTVGEGAQARKEVVRREGETVEILVSTSVGGVRVGEPERVVVNITAMQDHIRAGRDPLGRELLPEPTGTHEETLTIKGQTFRCLVETRVTEGRNRRVWFSSEGPIDGILKVEDDETSIVILTDFGSAP